MFTFFTHCKKHIYSVSINVIGQYIQNIIRFHKTFLLIELELEKNMYFILELYIPIFYLLINHNSKH